MASIRSVRWPWLSYVRLSYVMVTYPMALSYVVNPMVI